MKERKGLVFNVGTPSVLVILIVFVLTAFALLSIQASSNEKKLSDKTGESVQEYYKADQKAEYVKAYIEAVVQSVDASYLEETIVGMEASKEEYLKGIEGVSVQLKETPLFHNSGKKERLGTIGYKIPVRENCELEVEMVLYSNRSYDISKWKTTSESQGIELDEGMGLWDGSEVVE